MSLFSVFLHRFEFRKFLGLFQFCALTGNHNNVFVLNFRKVFVLRVGSVTPFMNPCCIKILGLHAKALRSWKPLALRQAQGAADVGVTLPPLSGIP